MSSWEIDADVNGYVEQRGYDLDVSGTTDLWHIDATGDGIFDQIGLDTTGEGVADTWFSDPNADGVADHIWTDTTGDGYADVWQYAQPGTSMGWELLNAPTGGQTVGVVGGDTGPDWTITDAAGNPVDPTALVGPSVVGAPTGGGTVSTLNDLFVQAQQTGTIWDQIAIFNMIQAQNSMIYDGIAMM